MDQKAFRHLSSLGFSDYEIKAYVALLTHGPSNGYQLAKLSGIPRPNIYAVLERLLERGAVISSHADGASEYQALPAEEMLNRLSHSVQSDIEHAKAALKKVNAESDQPLAWNIKGYDSLLAKADRMLRDAKEQVFIALFPEEAARLAPALSHLVKRGIKPTVLCLFGCEQECGGCEGRIYRYPMATSPDSRSLLLTTGAHETLVGQVNADGSAIGAHSTTVALTSMTTQYILNAIAVAEIVRSLGPKLLSIVDEEAMNALKGAGLSLNHKSWFERVSAMVRKEFPKGKKE